MLDITKYLNVHVKKETRLSEGKTKSWLNPIRRYFQVRCQGIWNWLNSIFNFFFFFLTIFISLRTGIGDLVINLILPVNFQKNLFKHFSISGAILIFKFLSKFLSPSTASCYIFCYIFSSGN